MDANATASLRRGPSRSQASPDLSLEPLACVACRARKLKCDRTKPACGRCLRAADGPMCVYPEARRKPMVKRRNVQDLEFRITQVEGLLNDGSSTDRADRANRAGPTASGRDGSGLFAIITEADDSGSDPGSYEDDNDACSSELVDLGMTESAPPYEIIEALHTAYFANQHMFIPIVHRARYLKAYHAGLHMRPPMGLQYVIWAMAAQVHPKYAGFHDAFYRRARQYLENDEMKGNGEHFITIGHAQAWALTAAYEARRLLFTRAAMSCSRCVRLVGMMGLSRLDGVDGVDGESEGDRIAATLPPPSDWTELEERRRVYWGAFCVDSHASISTGWPAVVNASEATTHLPCSEEAFNSGVEERSCSLDNIFSGSPYSTFSSAIVVCYLFNSILSHVQLRPGDRPDDFDNGRFWRRHRSLDNKLTSAFVFLPDRYRLPANFSNPVAVHTNLNLHAAVICLHNAALERAETHNMPEAVLQPTLDRLRIAANEIVNIIKRTSHMAGSYRSPLASLSLYCATSVFIYQAIQDEKGRTRDADSAKATAQSIELVMRCMDNGRSNNVTRLLLHQAILDIDRNGLAPSRHFSWFQKYSHRAVDTGHFVPVLARSSVSRHSWQQPPMAGRLPLISSHNKAVMKSQRPSSSSRSSNARSRGSDKGTANKRRRVQLQPREDDEDEGASDTSADADSLDTTLFPRYGGAFVVIPDRTTPSSGSGSSESAGPPSNGSVPPAPPAPPAMPQAAPAPPRDPPGMVLSSGGTFPQPYRPAGPSIFSHVQILDPWTGPRSDLPDLPDLPDLQAPELELEFGAGHPALAAADAFSTMPGLTGAAAARLDDALLAAQAQPNPGVSGIPDVPGVPGIQLDPALLYSGLDDILPGPGSENASIAAADAWTSFLQAGDLDRIETLYNTTQPSTSDLW